MNVLEIETLQAEGELACRHQTEADAFNPAVWAGSGLTTSAVWGGRISQLEPTITAKESPVTCTAAACGGMTQ